MQVADIKYVCSIVVCEVTIAQFGNDGFSKKVELLADDSDTEFSVNITLTPHNEKFQKVGTMASGFTDYAEACEYFNSAIQKTIPRIVSI